MGTSIFGSFLRHPGQVGALCASSASLGRKIAEMGGVEHAALTVELGPGTGALTREVLARRKDRDGRFLAVELDPALYAGLKRVFPDLELYQENAVHLPELLRKLELPAADVIIAGLPWAIFPEQLQLDILDAVRRSLKPGGYFLTFAYIQGVYLPAGRRFRCQLEANFCKIEKSPVIWRNLPPAFIYRCQLKED